MRITIRLRIPQPFEFYSAWLFARGTLICSWCFWAAGPKTPRVINQAKFFHALGRRVRQLRKARGYTQEDMISFGFSSRHWQQIEGGRAVTMRTVLRICDVFSISLERLVARLDRGIYRH